MHSIYAGLSSNSIVEYDLRGRQEPVQIWEGGIMGSKGRGVHSLAWCSDKNGSDILLGANIGGIFAMQLKNNGFHETIVDLPTGIISYFFLIYFLLPSFGNLFILLYHHLIFI